MSTKQGTALKLIFERMNMEDMKNASIVCRAWYHASYGHHLWKNCCVTSGDFSTLEQFQAIMENVFNKGVPMVRLIVVSEDTRSRKKKRYMKHKWEKLDKPPLKFANVIIEFKSNAVYDVFKYSPANGIWAFFPDVHHLEVIVSAAGSLQKEPIIGAVGVHPKGLQTVAYFRNTEHGYNAQPSLNSEDNTYFFDETGELGEYDSICHEVGSLKHLQYLEQQYTVNNLKTLLSTLRDLKTFRITKALNFNVCYDDEDRNMIHINQILSCPHQIVETFDSFSDEKECSHRINDGLIYVQMINSTKALDSAKRSRSYVPSITKLVRRFPDLTVNLEIDVFCKELRRIYISVKKIVKRLRNERAVNLRELNLSYWFDEFKAALEVDIWKEDCSSCRSANGTGQLMLGLEFD